MIIPHVFAKLITPPHQCADIRLEKDFAIISDYQDIPADSVNADTQLINDPGSSSFAVVSLVDRFENKFDIEVPDRKIKLMKTVDAIVIFIESATEE